MTSGNEVHHTFSSKSAVPLCSALLELIISTSAPVRNEGRVQNSLNWSQAPGSHQRPQKGANVVWDVSVNHVAPAATTWRRVVPHIFVPVALPLCHRVFVESMPTDAARISVSTHTESAVQARRQVRRPTSGYSTQECASSWRISFSKIWLSGHGRAWSPTLTMCSRPGAVAGHRPAAPANRRSPGERASDAQARNALRQQQLQQQQHQHRPAAPAHRRSPGERANDLQARNALRQQQLQQQQHQQQPKQQQQQQPQQQQPRQPQQQRLQQRLRQSRPAGPARRVRAGEQHRLGEEHNLERHNQSNTFSTATCEPCETGEGL